MIILLAIVFLILSVIFIVKVFNEPMLGLMLVFAVNPLEPFFPDFGGLTLGRLLGTLTMVAWIYFLWRNPDAYQKFIKSGLTKRSIWFIVSLLISLLIWINEPDGDRTLKATVTFVLLIVLSWMIESLILSKKDLINVAFGMALAGLIACIPAVAFNLGVDLYTPLGAEAPTDLTEESLRATTVGGNPNSLGIVARNGIFAAILLIIFSSKFWIKVLGAIFFFGTVLGLVLSGSRTNFYGTLVFLSFMIMFSGQFKISSLGSLLRLLVFLAGAVYLGLTFVPEPVKKRLFLGGGDDRIAERAQRRQEFTEGQQEQSIEFIRKYPLFGVGLDRTYYESNYVIGAHDTISVVLGEAGIMGFIGLSIIMFWAMTKSWRTLKKNKNVKIKLSLSLLTGMLLSMIIMGYKGGFIIPYDRTFWMVLGLVNVLASKRFIESLDIPKGQGRVNQTRSVHEVTG